jgi:hypothetical protein
LTVWHHGSPGRSILDTPHPPFRSGRYHRTGGRPTWYGSSTEGGAKAEFARSLPPDVEASEFRRRLGRVDLDLVVLDLTNPELQRALRIDQSDLVSDDLETCETLADLAADAGFDGVWGPSAATPDVQTLAVFGTAIADRSRGVVDLGLWTTAKSGTDSSPRRRR